MTSWLVAAPGFMAACGALAACRLPQPSAPRADLCASTQCWILFFELIQRRHEAMTSLLRAAPSVIAACSVRAACRLPEPSAPRGGCPLRKPEIQHFEILYLDLGSRTSRCWMFVLR